VLAQKTVFLLNDFIQFLDGTIRMHGIWNVGHDDGDDNVGNRAIDIREIHRQCGSVRQGRLQESGALSVRRHCSHVECGLLEARRWGKRDYHDEEGVPAMLATCTLLRIGWNEFLAILAWALWLCCWESGLHADAMVTHFSMGSNSACCWNSFRNF